MMPGVHPRPLVQRMKANLIRWLKPEDKRRDYRGFCDGTDDYHNELQYEKLGAEESSKATGGDDPPSGGLL